MSTLMLYLIVILSWGSSWLAIKFQIGEAPPTISVSYRFLLAGALLLLYGLWRKQSFRFSLRQHSMIAMQALFLFCMNYILIYFSETHLVSGVVSVIFSTLAFMNIINARLFLGQPVRKEAAIACLIGFLGVMLVFKNELVRLDGSSTGLLTGLILCLSSAYSASVGNIVSLRNQQKEKLPLIPATALGMLYGGAMTFIASQFMGEKVVFPLTVGYLGSLVYLSVIASIVAFLAYLTLLGKLGAAKAGYTTFLFPLVAIILSVFFEGYTLSSNNVMGFVLILAGNYLIMNKQMPSLRSWWPSSVRHSGPVGLMKNPADNLR